MKEPLIVRRRLPDGSFGDPVNVFGKGETSAVKVTRLEGDNAIITFALIEKDMQLNDLEASQAALLFQLIEKGVL